MVRGVQNDRRNKENEDMQMTWTLGIRMMALLVNRIPEDSKFALLHKPGDLEIFPN